MFTPVAPEGIHIPVAVSIKQSHAVASAVAEDFLFPAVSPSLVINGHFIRIGSLLHVGDHKIHLAVQVKIGGTDKMNDRFDRLPAVLHQEGLDERIDVAVENILDIACFQIGPEVFDQFVGMKDVIPDL